MTKTVIVLNSPPLSGKDTLANILVKELAATKLEFKEALYEKTAVHYGLDTNYLKFIATSRKYKDNLVSVFSKNFKMTPREALIHVSEEVIKPIHGQAYFGERAAEKLVDGLNVFADGGGWWPELLPVAKEADKTIVCRLYRHGFNFDYDSRRYYDYPMPTEAVFLGVALCDIHLEDGNPKAAVDSIKNLITGKY